MAAIDAVTFDLEPSLSAGSLQLLQRDWRTVHIDLLQEGGKELAADPQFQLLRRRLPLVDQDRLSLPVRRSNSVTPRGKSLPNALTKPRMSSAFNFNDKGLREPGSCGYIHPPPLPAP